MSFFSSTFILITLYLVVPHAITPIQYMEVLILLILEGSSKDVMTAENVL